MKFEGNFAEYIKSEWAEECLSLPRDWDKPFCEGSPEMERLQKADYDLSHSMWAVIEPENVNFKPDFPFLEGKRYEWWIARILTGQLMPMHKDDESFEEIVDATVHWIPLQDYQSGHVFVINDELITDYKKGDVYTFSKFSDLHGAANIGMVPKLTIMVVVYND
jgi:hypothetical protein|tara:strand:+ start:198 stop:689 length:492 start_codon:yes stop_codon:yes gene_type:complete